ncbi:Bax inhibitor-1/YccA family protein [Thalassoroseus pseudoceratinae]|uniref:Bax inhibitor-1/YccA family protein n=1 Tax=Thalassoroseus pseudoceratinae TaxID=2713176 RepID=UPI001420DAC1|nr:Bax inhibitor-1 family protein [Thalassoroseus pseudoceratinae]
MGYAQEYAESDRFDGQNAFAADLSLEHRLAFLRKVYVHVFGAIVAFIALEAVILNIAPLRDALFGMFVATNGLILLGFIAVSWICHKWAYSEVSQQTQYVGLGVYVFAEALFFAPLLHIASGSDPRFAAVGGSPHVIPTAAFLTLLIFGGLTAFVLLTKTDFSFMRGILSVITMAALGLIVASFFTPISLGLWFIVAMVVLFSGWILYDTSNILHHFPTHMYVAASLELFASIATLFWYMIRLVMMFAGDD